MNIKEVKDLIQDILHSDITEFEMEHTGTKVRLRRGFASGDGAAVPAAPVAGRPESQPVLAVPAVAATPCGPPPLPPPPTNSTLTEVKPAGGVKVPSDRNLCTIHVAPPVT